MIIKNTAIVCMIIIFISCNSKNSGTKSEDSLQTKSEKISDSKDTLSRITDYFSIGENIVRTEIIGKIRYKMLSSKVIEIYGEPEEKSDPEIWGQDGENHQTYKYTKEGIELDLIGNVGPDQRIDMITISMPFTGKTLKNIGIGSSYNDVTTAYKNKINPDLTDEQSIVVGSEYAGMIFNFKENKVISIFIGESAE